MEMTSRLAAVPAIAAAYFSLESPLHAGSAAQDAMTSDAAMMTAGNLMPE
jgi:hypothetical protein